MEKSTYMLSLWDWLKYQTIMNHLFCESMVVSLNGIGVHKPTFKIEKGISENWKSRLYDKKIVMIKFFLERIVPSIDGVSVRKSTVKMREPIHQNRMGVLHNKKIK